MEQRKIEPTERSQPKIRKTSVGAFGTEDTAWARKVQIGGRDCSLALQFWNQGKSNAEISKECGRIGELLTETCMDRTIAKRDEKLVNDLPYSRKAIETPKIVQRVRRDPTHKRKNPGGETHTLESCSKFKRQERGEKLNVEERQSEFTNKQANEKTIDSPQSLHPPMMLSSEDEFWFQSTPTGPSLDINSRENFIGFLQNQNCQAVESFQSWAPNPAARWVHDMFQELSDEDREYFAESMHIFKKGCARKGICTILSEWPRHSEFAMEIIERWFVGKTLGQVLERAEQLGHMNLESGRMIKGRFSIELKDCTQDEFTLKGVVQYAKRLSERENRDVNFFSTRRENAFVADTKTVSPDQLDETIAAERAAGRSVGSLDTTFHFGSRKSKVRFLDSYRHFLKDTLSGCSGDVALSPLLYLIWKSKGYLTAHHQDFHAPPHFTLYNQLSGHSCFHFLPLLVGLFVTHVAVSRSKENLVETLREIDRRAIGSIVHVKTGDSVIICPFGSHGVWVPQLSKDGEILDNTASVVRAAELESVKVRANIKESMINFKKEHH